MALRAAPALMWLRASSRPDCKPTTVWFPNSAIMVAKTVKTESRNEHELHDKLYGDYMFNTNYPQIIINMLFSETMFLFND